MIKEPPALVLRRGFARPSAAQAAAFADAPTGFVCDAMDGRGALDSRIRPVAGAAAAPRAVGPAVVAECGPAGILGTKGALHIMQPGDVVVAAVHGHRNCSAAGDLFCGMMANKGAAGFVTDGEMRDCEGIAATGLPAWCAGLCPNSPHSTGPARAGFGADIGGRRVESGDLIVADANGVVVVPLAMIDGVIERLAEVRRLEEELEAKVASGFCRMQDVEEMLADGRAILED